MKKAELNQYVKLLEGRSLMILDRKYSQIQKFTVDKRVIELAKAIQRKFPDEETLEKAYRFYARHFPKADCGSKTGYLLTNIINYCCIQHSRKLQWERDSEDPPLNLDFPHEMFISKNGMPYEPVPYIKIKLQKEIIGTIPNLVFIDELPVLIFPRLAKWNEKEIPRYKKLGRIVKFTFGQNPACILCEDINRFQGRGGSLTNYKFPKKMSGLVLHYYQKHGIITTYFSRTRDEIYGLAKEFEDKFQKEKLEEKIAEEERLKNMPQEEKTEEEKQDL